MFPLFFVFNYMQELMVVISPKIVTTITILQGLAMIGYFIAGDYPRGLYWLGAVVLTLSTLLIK